ncbi:hypothetical protein D3C79_1052020 [compost metagenome]
MPEVVGTYALVTDITEPRQQLRQSVPYSAGAALGQQQLQRVLDNTIEQDVVGQLVKLAIQALSVMQIDPELLVDYELALDHT